MAAPASQVRSTLSDLADNGVARLAAVLAQLDGTPESIRGYLLDLTPVLISAYSDGTSSLAADWYDDLREQAAPARAFTAEPVVVERWEKVGRMVAWSSEPLFLPEPDRGLVAKRLLPEVQKEIVRPFRDTVTTNSKRDPASVGWRRVSSGSGCKFCRMLADKGAIFKAETARFAAHGNCHCSAAPAFDGGDGPEASALQYVASQRRRSPQDRARLREHLNANY